MTVLALTWQQAYHDGGIWVAAILTLAIFSFLYRDNPVYKLAEHIFVGVAAGYTVAYAYWQVFVPNLWYPLHGLYRGSYPGRGTEEWWWTLLLHVPAALGLLFFLRFSRRFSWLSRWAIAFLVGAYAGVNLIAYFQSDLILQTKGTFVLLDPARLAEDGWYKVLALNIPILIGVLASLTYFFFSKPHRGVLGVSARTGIFFLMAAFGASFGYTVMARISLFIGRLQFLSYDWIYPLFDLKPPLS